MTELQAVLLLVAAPSLGNFLAGAFRAEALGLRLRDRLFPHRKPQSDTIEAERGRLLSIRVTSAPTLLDARIETIKYRLAQPPYDRKPND